MEAGWYADPTDRFERRFWNGHRWTEDVAIGTHRLRDLVQVETEGEVPFHIAPSHPLHGDPLSPPPAPTPEPGALPPPGASAAALPPLPHATGTEPMAQPVTAPGPGPGLGQHLIGVIRDRPVSRLTDAVAAVGGTLFAIGIIAAAGGDDLATAGLVVSSLALIVLGYAIVLTPLRPLRAAAVAMVAIGIVVLSFAALQSTVEDGHLGGPLALVTVLAVAAYLAPGLRGRPFLLGMAVFGLMLMLAALAAETADDIVEDIVDDSVQSVSAVLLVVGAIYAGATAYFDRRGYRGAGTAFAAAAIVGVVVGTVGTASRFGEGGGAVLVLLAGAALVAVGNISGRRATMWTGAALLAGGVIAIVAVILGSDASPIAAGLLIAVAGLVVAGVAYYLQLRRRYVAAPPAAVPPPAR